MDIFNNFIAENNFEYHLISGNRLVVITAVDSDGNNKMECYDERFFTLWEVTPPVYNFQKGNRFVGLHFHEKANSYSVNDFNGVRYWFSLETGEIYDKDFVK
ncbi:MAG: hypothetical protein K2K57_06420 [Oscillospiraceae bacterium]|nr:hypothetical protein [Oscillospiraceae bacterium]